MQRCMLVPMWILLVSSLFSASAGEGEVRGAKRILAATGFKGGLVVHLGCGSGRLTAALAHSGNRVVHGLDASPQNVSQARRYLRSQGRYGSVAVDLLRDGRLPYADSSVNLVFGENTGVVTRSEIERVLCPGGVAYTRTNGEWKRSDKPWPAAIDSWTHCMYDASGNAVSKDTVVAPPHHLQWVGEPRHSRQHEKLGSVSAVVSAAGRLFSIQDEGPAASVLLPAAWFLVARDAFNGVVLWKKPMDSWESHLRTFRSGPPELARRLVACGDRVYATLGFGQPIVELDAATGDTIRTYAETATATEFVLEEGIVYVVLGPDGLPSRVTAAKRRGAAVPSPAYEVCAVSAATGEVVWRRSGAATATVMPTTLAVSGDRTFYQTVSAVHALNAKTGATIWQAPRPVTTQRPSWSAPTLVV